MIDDATGKENGILIEKKKEVQGPSYIQVKVELHDVQENLEDAQELAGQLVLSENNKMTVIDQLHEEVKTLKAQIDKLKMQNK